MQHDFHRPILTWLLAVCVFILVIVTVGGITRLTGSGLSIVRWELFIGIAPPTSPEAWEEKFDAYQGHSQYQKLNPDMTLQEFKVIFFWEYIHRLLGRILGLFYLGGFLVFLVRKKLDRPLALKLFIGFLLLSLQGVLGWLMVASGLKDNPHVSHYRLAAHLMAAFVLFAYLVWIMLDLTRSERPERDFVREGRLSKGAGFILVVLTVQILYGAFVAGTKAGFMYNSFPTMLGYWVPPGLTAMSPIWVNLFENRLTLQFIHRGLAWVLLLAVVLFWLCARRHDQTPRQWTLVACMTGLFLLQFLLGIMTLVLHVPIGLASMHQLNACLLFGAVVGVVHSYSR